MRHISLFSGIGGDTLAAQWAGFETVLFVENDKFCQKVLKKHWPDVPIIGDIKDATKEAIANSQSDRLERWGLARSYGNEQPPRICEKSKGNKRTDNQSPITLITGGFPCQPVSQAGKQRGKEDDRWLWPEMLRVISEVGPRWVVAENVAGLIGMGLNDCISDLEGEGFEVQTFLIPACAVNAPHRRDRIFIVAHARCLSDNGWGSKCRGQEGTGSCDRATRSGEYAVNVADPPGGRGGQMLSRFPGGLLSKDRTPPESQGSGGVIPDSSDIRCSLGERGRTSECLRKSGGFAESSWWAIEPDVGRVAYGVPSRVDRLKGLGNAIVPQQIYPILKAIADIEAMI